MPPGTVPGDRRHRRPTVPLVVESRDALFVVIDHVRSITALEALLCPVNGCDSAWHVGCACQTHGPRDEAEYESCRLVSVRVNRL